MRGVGFVLAAFMVAGCGGNGQERQISSSPNGSGGSAGTSGTGASGGSDGGMTGGTGGSTGSGGGGSGGGVGSGGSAGSGGGGSGGSGGGTPSDYTWTVEQAASSIPSHIWASSATDVWVAGPVLRSDGDGTWTRQPWPYQGLAAMTVTGAGPGDVYVGAQLPGTEHSSTVFRTTGDGTWTSVFGTWALNAVFAMGNEIWVGDGDGVQRSFDHGATFTQVAETTAYTGYDISGDGLDRVAVGVTVQPSTPGYPPPGQNPPRNGFVIVSHDGGNTFAKQISTEWTGMAAQVRGGVIYIGVAYSVPAYRTAILRSDDGGKTWRDVSPTAVTLELANVGLWAAGPNELWAASAGGNGLMRTVDGGKTWQARLGGSDPVYGVHGAGPNDVYAVGGGFVLHGHR
jgi:hypothetical protein